MTDHTERVIERVCNVGKFRVPDADRDLPPLSPDERDDRRGAIEHVDHVEFKAPIGGAGEPEPEPFDDTFERMKALDRELERFDW